MKTRTYLNLLSTGIIGLTLCACGGGGGGDKGGEESNESVSSSSNSSSNNTVSQDLAPTSLNGYTFTKNNNMYKFSGYNIYNYVGSNRSFNWNGAYTYKKTSATTGQLSFSASVIGVSSSTSHSTPSALTLTFSNSEGALKVKITGTEKLVITAVMPITNQLQTSTSYSTHNGTYTISK